MKQFFTLIFAGMVCAASAQQKIALKRDFSLNESAPYEPGVLIVKLKPAHRNLMVNGKVQHPALSAVMNTLKAASINRIFPLATPPATLRNAQGNELVDLSLMYQISCNGTNIPFAIKQLQKTCLFEYVEPKYIMQTFYTPNDPSLGQCYHLGKINAYTAWDTQKGDTNVVIGIVDSGTDWDHPDLAPNLKLNWADPINGVDDDNDGYIDNFRGWDISENDNNPVVDNSSHGSHVSGCAAAATDNNIGVAGTGFNCKFLPIKASKQASTTQIDNGYEAIVYAADHGCDIINCSWGGAGGSTFGQDVINYATFNQDALVVVSAGNTSTEQDIYPGAYENVLAVAATGSSDARASYSTFGYWVDVCAPGTNVYSTYYNNTYSNQSGTSMSSPVTAGAAAIVKSQFPAYTAKQVGERIRMTSDYVYNLPQNINIMNKIGKGRVNMGNAISAATPAVRFENILLTDNNDNTFVIGDTINVTGILRNYLDPTVNLSVTMSSTSTAVTVLNSTVSPGVINTLDSFDVSPTPYSLYVKPNAPKNTKVILKFTFTDGTYDDWQYITLTVNVDYINVMVNQTWTTISSRGRIGYNNDNQVEGLGFVYKQDDNLMYESALMIGRSTSSVSDEFRGTSGSPNDDDFVSQVTVQKVPNVLSDFDLYGKFNDNAAVPQIKVDVTHKAFAWDDAGFDKFVIVEYTITNKNTTSLSNIYAGIATDWDIQTYANNKSAEDQNLKMGYSWCTDAGGLFAGTKLLTTGSFKHYALDNINGGGGGIDIANGYSTSEKYTSLSTNRATAGGTGTGNDVIDVVSSGPFTIPVGDSIKVAFALLAGDSLGDLLANALAAQIKYDGIISAGIYDGTGQVTSIRVFPNPTKDRLYIASEEKIVTITVYDVAGKLIAALPSNGSALQIVDLTTLPLGVYAVKTETKTAVQITRVLKQ
ncbi:MAG: S8 family peptidase [Bacteroidetes bacterium]|nr:S8 family peptidase [Bacteroidota bacterium]